MKSIISYIYPELFKEVCRAIKRESTDHVEINGGGSKSRM